MRPARRHRPDVLPRVLAQDTTRGLVVSYTSGSSDAPEGHECATRRLIAQKLAALQDYEYAGDFDELSAYDRPVYFVPAVTLSLECADQLGIVRERDLFGGVVPYPFVATKTITHGLTNEKAYAPFGWSHEFPARVRDSVLAGYTAFSAADARRAGALLIERGALRVKAACETGGRGQFVAADGAALARILGRFSPAELESYGVVLEQNLTDVKTYSIGHVRVGDLVASYFGTQKLTRDHHGLDVYGGSVLTVVRGEFDALLGFDLDEGVRTAVRHARTYDAAATDCFPGFFASRRNYDVVEGRDREGVRRCGVLEQSWRIGGASSAEVAALEAFRRDPALNAVRVECTEVYDEHAVPPSDATVYFHGIDPKVGWILKYATAVTHGDA
jgi:Protein of unknown function (DUF3182)